MKTQITIASDHAGYDLKEFLKKSVTNVDWIDEGPASNDRTDYPDYAAKVAGKVSAGQINLGVLVCGSGIGMCIAANKFSGVRAAVVESTEAAKLSRAHNNANILCVGARLMTPEYAKEVIEAWLVTPFEGGRHADRIAKITELEKTTNGRPKK